MKSLTYIFLLISPFAINAFENLPNAYFYPSDDIDGGYLFYNGHYIYIYKMKHYENCPGCH